VGNLKMLNSPRIEKSEPDSCDVDRRLIGHLARMVELLDEVLN